MEEMEGRVTPDHQDHDRNGLICGVGTYKLRDVFTWQLLKTMAMGQCLSALLCGAAITSHYLLLDCFVIPVLMALSWFFLKTRYRIVHYVAVFVCLIGVGAMVGADLLASRDQGSTTDILLGDGLVLISATLFAVSNVCLEYTVKNLSRVEFLGMVGLFGTLISGIQLGIVEHRDVAKIQWNWKIALFLTGYVLCFYAFYSLMPVVVKMSNATVVNLSLLTTDLFGILCGIYLFQYSFSGLYIVSLVGIMVGFVMFSAVPTLNPVLEQTPDEGGYDNHASVFDDEDQPDSVMEIPSENMEGERGEEVEECDHKDKTQNYPAQSEPAHGVGNSTTKM